MQRRNLLHSRVATSGSVKESFSTPLPPPTGTLAPYSGPWTEATARHLVSRACFGVSVSHVKQSLSIGLSGSVEALTADITPPAPPVNYDFESDPEVPIGSTWIDALHSVANNGNNYRIRSMRGWIMGRVLSGEFHIREKMTLFWHNHFPTSDVNDARFQYKYVDTLRTNALGNFKDLVKKITIDPSMLRYLNGNQNTRRSPNENYARELLELFTVGKGPLADPGDYTHYTEHDVREIAKILTGWRDTGYRNAITPLGVQFRANLHDTSTKTLSHRFNNAVIDNAGDAEYAQLIDIIFMQEEVSRFIARKLYRWFLYYKIDEAIETTIIEPLAAIIRDNNYNIKPAIIALLSSEHFYLADHIGCMIKNPMDFLANMIVTLDISVPTDLARWYQFYLRIYNSTSNLQMVYFFPPAVAGWKPYYQVPSFYQIWLNSVTMPLRKTFSDTIFNVGVFAGDKADDIGYIPFIEQLVDPWEVNGMLTQITALFFAKPLTEEQLAALKEVLIPGLPDYEWSVEYSDYKANPNDDNLRIAIESKLRNLFIYIGRMPEFQLH